jgi:hypothetical protein
MKLEFQSTKRKVCIYVLPRITRNVLQRVDTVYKETLATDKNIHIRYSLLLPLLFFTMLLASYIPHCHLEERMISRNKHTLINL